LKGSVATLNVAPTLNVAKHPDAKCRTFNAKCRNILNYRLCRNLNAKCCTFCLCYDVYIQNVALCCSFISKIVSCIVLTGYLYGRRLQKTIGYSSNLEDTAIYREYIISKASLVPVHSDVQNRCIWHRFTFILDIFQNISDTVLWIMVRPGCPRMIIKFHISTVLERSQCSNRVIHVHRLHYIRDGTCN
jgi:hypothetical protein